MLPHTLPGNTDQEVCQLLNQTGLADSKVWVYPNHSGALLALFLGVLSRVEGDGEEGDGNPAPL